jgi:DNA replication protein DnaC
MQMEHLPKLPPLSPLLVRQPDREDECIEHGAFQSRNVVGRIWAKCPTCEKRQADQEADAKRVEEAASAARRQEAMLGATAIPARFIGRAFDGFKAQTPSQVHALTVCRAYAEDFASHRKRGTGLILSGMPGTGKSHLAAAILQYLLPADVRYTTCLDMIRAIRDTWRRDSDRSETQVLALLRDFDLLAVDEVGVQYGTEGEQTVLFDVLDRRYREMRPTILLTNQNRDGLRGFVGDRAYDRLTETCRWVPFDWESYRATARKEVA